MLVDLKRRLDRELGKIIESYTNYQICIRESLQAKGVDAKELVTNLLTISAFNHTEQKRTLLSAHETELKKATDLYDVFNLITKEYASFMNCDLLQFILKKYDIDCGQEELKYPEHLKAYLENHEVSKFLEINPLLKKYTAASTEFVLKLDIEPTSRMAKLQEIKTAVAKILDLNSAALQLLDVNLGCVIATFLLPTPVAELVFNKRTILTVKQEEQFLASGVLWLECNNCRFSFTTQGDQDNQAQT